MQCDKHHHRNRSLHKTLTKRPQWAWLKGGNISSGVEKSAKILEKWKPKERTVHKNAHRPESSWYPGNSKWPEVTGQEAMCQR